MTTNLLERIGYRTLAEMCEAERPFVYRVVYGKIGNQATAADLTQDTFEKALLNIDGFTPKSGRESRSSLRSWLARIAKNSVIDYTRRRKLETSTAEEEGLDLDPDMVMQGDYNFNNPEYLLQRKRGLEALTKAFGDIENQGMRNAAISYHVHGMGFDEISARDGVKEGTLRVWVHRAKERIERDERVIPFISE